MAKEIDINKLNYDIKHIYSSDLPRALQTAEAISDALQLPTEKLSQFREANNGDLAGMPNNIANQKYPGLYWNTLEWEQQYPNGENPKEFYERIKKAWYEFQKMIQIENENVLLVTHSGVINIIIHLINSTCFSNKEKQESIKNARLIELENGSGSWCRK